MGIPSPGETILLIAAAAAAAGNGQIVWVIVAAAAGAVIGDNVAFSLGRRHGRAILRRVMHLGEGKLAQSEAFFERHGPKTVFIARFIPVVRSVSAYLAGINQMSPRTFAVYNLAGGVTWAVVIGSLGYIFGKNLHLIEAILRRVGGVLAAVLLVGAFILWLNHRWRQSERNYLSGRIGVTFSWMQARWRQMMLGGQRRLLLYGLLVLLSSWATGVLVDDWVQNEPELYRRDQLVTQWLQIGAAETPGWVEGIAFVGDVRVLTGVAGLTAVWLWLQKQRRLSLLSLGNAAGALALGWGLQVWLKRPLPISPEPAWRLTIYAFPHLSSLLAVAVLGWLTYVWGCRREWSSQVNVGTAVVFVIAGISITSLYLAQAHLSDVLAGLSMGLLWLGIPLALANTEFNSAKR